MPIDKGILEEYVATANSGKYKSFAEINEKFPELKDYDANVLEEYVATSNSGKYKSWDEINGKFPELFSDPVKKKEPLALGFESASEASRIGGLQKPETVSQSPLSAPLKSPSVSKQPTWTPQQQKSLVDKIKSGDLTAETPEEEGYLSRIGGRIVRGMNTLNQNLAKTPEFIYNIAAMPQNIIAENFDVPSLAVSAEKVKKDLGITNQVADYYSDKINQLAYLDEKYVGSNGSVTTLVKDGKYLDAAKLLGEQIAESLPTTAAIAASGGLGATPSAITLGGGAVFGAAKYDEIADREDLSESEKASIALSTGLVEGLIENIGTANLGRVAKEIFTNSAADVAKAEIKNTFSTAYKEALKKYMPISGAISEGIEEAATQFAQNAIDIYSGVDPNKKITDGLMDALIVGTGSGAVISSPTLLSKNRNKEVVNKQAEVEQIDAELQNENISDNSKQTLVQARQQKMSEINDILDVDIQEQRNIPEESKREIEALSEEIDVISQDIERATTDATKQLLGAKLQEIEQRIDELSQPTNETQETEETPSSEAVTDTIVSDGSATPTTVKSTEVVEPNVSLTNERNNIESGENIGIEPTEKVVSEEGSAGVGGVETQSQEEFAQYLQDNHSDKLNQDQIYKLLTVRPELRERMLNESPQEWAKIFEKNPDYRQQANNVDNNQEMRGNANPAWTGISIGETANLETDGRHKGYVTLDVNSAREMGKNLEQTFKDLYKKLKEAGYNGHLKMPGVYSDLLTRFDNIVIHGATKGDISLALPIIEQYFKDKGFTVEGTKTGIDAKDSNGKETSHTNLLAEKVKNKQLTKAVEELVKPKSSENKPTISKKQQPTDVAKEEGSGVGGDNPALKEIGVEIKKDGTSEGFYQVYKDGKFVGLLGATSFEQARNKGQHFDEGLMSDILTRMGIEHSKAERNIQGENEFLTIRIKNSKAVEQSLKETPQPETKPSESERKSENLAVSKKERVAERKAIAEAKVDEVADKLKAFLRNNNLPEGTKTSGVNQDKIIDVLASTVKALVNSGIEINDAIAKVREYLNEEYDTSGIEDYEIKQSIARDELTDYAKEQGFTSYRNAVFAVNKYVKPVGKEDVITKEDIDKAKEAKAEASKEDEAPKGQTLSGRSKSYEEKRVPVSEQYREAVNAKKVFYQAEGLQSFADAAIEYLAGFGDSIQGLNNAYDDMVKVYNDNPYYRAYNSIAIELLSDRLFAEGEKAYLDGDTELANQFFAKSDNLRVMAFNAARKAGQYNAALAIFSSSRNPDAFAMFVNKEINKEADKIRAIKQPKIDEGVKEFKSKVRKAQTEAANEAVKSAPRKQAVRTNKFSEIKERGVKRQKEALSKLKKLGFLGSNGLNNEAIEAIGELIVAQLEIGVYKAANIIQRIKAMTNGNVTDEHIKETYDKYKIKYEGNEYSLTELSDLLNKQEQAELLQSDPEKYIEQQAKEKLSAGKGKTLTLSELLERDLAANETAEGISKNIQKEFGLSEKEANLIANKFYDKYKSLLKLKIEKALMSSLGIKNVKEIDRRESAGEIKPFEKTLGGKIVAEVLAGALDSSQTIEDAFSVKYGIPVMTPTIRDNIRQLSKRVNAATTILGQRTANRNLISYIQEQLPTSAGSVLKTAYYVSLLSGVSTAAVNTWGNVNTLMNQAVGENFVQSIIEAFQGNKANLVSSVQGKAKLRAATTNMNRALVAFTDIMARGGGENKYYNLNQKAINEFDSERLILKKQDLKNLGLNRLAAALGKLYYTAPAIINRNLSASDEAFYSLNYNVEATREIRKKLYKETDLRGKALEDAVFQQVYGTKEIMLEAMVQAEKEMLNIGMTPNSNKKLAKRIAYELISRKLDKEVQNTAEKIAAENTYRGELRGAMGYIGTVVPQMALITPFVNTVVKIAEKHMNYIPVYGILRTSGFSLTDNLRKFKDINDYFERKGIEKTKRTGELRNKQIAQVILSHSLLGVFYALSQMSWTDDDDKKEKPLLEVSGGYIGMPYAKQQQGREIMPEYTLRIKDFKINYKNNPLLAMICLPLAVKMDNDRMGLKTERPINSYSFALSMYLYDAVPIKNIQEFFTSLAKTTDKFSDVEPENMVKEVVKSFAMIPANLLAPNTYKQIFDYMNPQKYQTNDYKEALWKAINMEKIGGLIPSYDMWGKPEKLYPGETFMPIQYILRDDKDDDVTQWAVSKNISLPSLNRKTLVLDLDSKTGYTKKEWDKKQVRDNAEFLTVEMQELAQKANFRVLTYSEWAEMDATIRNNVYQIISRNLNKVADNGEMIEMLKVIEVPLNDMTSIKANKAVDILFELERQKYINDKFLTGLEDDNTN